MPELKGSKTHQNLKDAFAGESQANRRYLYYAKQADVEGYPEIASNFRETAEGETGHAHGHLDYIKQVGDPANDMPIGESSDNLKAAIAGETHEYTDMYPGMAKTAREEGFSEIADWFETLAKAEKSHAGRFQQMLDSISWLDTFFIKIRESTDSWFPYLTEYIYLIYHKNIYLLEKTCQLLKKEFLTFLVKE